jgi:hypothetical protein
MAILPTTIGVRACGKPSHQAISATRCTPTSTSCPAHGVRCGPAPTRGAGSSSRTWNTPPAVSTFDPTHQRATKAPARVIPLNFGPATTLSNNSPRNLSDWKEYIYSTLLCWLQSIQLEV